MRFKGIPIEGAFYIEINQIADERGYFARTFCKDAFLANDLQVAFEQSSLSFNRCKRTLRGMHFQIAPFEEIKIVTCLQGSIYDVILDLRPNSKTFLQWYAVELNGNQGNSLYIPKGCAHGFQTLEDNTKVLYQISQSFVPAAYRGVRWNDPQFAITWPYTDNLIISAKDQQHPDYISEVCNFPPHI